MNAETQTVVQFIIGQAKQTPGIILKRNIRDYLATVERILYSCADSHISSSTINNFTLPITTFRKQICYDLQGKADVIFCFDYVSLWHDFGRHSIQQNGNAKVMARNVDYDEESAFSEWNETLFKNASIPLLVVPFAGVQSGKDFLLIEGNHRFGTILRNNVENVSVKVFSDFAVVRNYVYGKFQRNLYIFLNQIPKLVCDPSPIINIGDCLSFFEIRA